MDPLLARARIIAFELRWNRRDSKKMASSSETFEKFETWKRDKTLLRVTIIVKSETTDVLLARIASNDSNASLVLLEFDATRSFQRLNVEYAEFAVDSSRVVITRNDSDWLILEEAVNL